jgi:hypothetical protein
MFRMLATSGLTLLVAGATIALVFTTYSWISDEKEVVLIPTTTPLIPQEITPIPRVTLMPTGGTDVSTPIPTKEPEVTMSPVSTELHTPCLTVALPFPTVLPTVVCVPHLP